MSLTIRLRGWKEKGSDYGLMDHKLLFEYNIYRKKLDLVALLENIL